MGKTVSLLGGNITCHKGNSVERNFVRSGVYKGGDASHLGEDFSVVEFGRSLAPRSARTCLAWIA